MDYISSKYRDKHDVIVREIKYERLLITRHHTAIKRLQERLLKIGTEDEQNR